MKFRLTIEYQIPDEEFGTKNKDKMLNTEAWLLSIKGAVRHLDSLDRTMEGEINLEIVDD